MSSICNSATNVGIEGFQPSASRSQSEPSEQTDIYPVIEANTGFKPVNKRFADVPFQSLRQLAILHTLKAMIPQPLVLETSALPVELRVCKHSMSKYIFIVNYFQL